MHRKKYENKNDKQIYIALCVPCIIYKHRKFLININAQFLQIEVVGFCLYKRLRQLLNSTESICWGQSRVRRYLINTHSANTSNTCLSSHAYPQA